MPIGVRGVSVKTEQDNREVVFQFFGFLRELVLSTIKNQNDPGDYREAAMLANYLKDVIADALEQRESGKLPVLSLCIYGSRSGHTEGRFQIPREMAIIEAWRIQELAGKLDKMIIEWDLTLESHPDKADMTEYTAIKEHIKRIK